MKIPLFVAFGMKYSKIECNFGAKIQMLLEAIFCQNWIFGPIFDFYNGVMTYSIRNRIVTSWNSSQMLKRNVKWGLNFHAKITEMFELKNEKLMYKEHWVCIGKWFESFLSSKASGSPFYFQSCLIRKQQKVEYINFQFRHVMPRHLISWASNRILGI